MAERGIEAVETVPLAGANWYPAELRSSFRAYDKPGAYENDIGFRCAATVPAGAACSPLNDWQTS